MRDPSRPTFMRVFCLPTPKEGEIAPKKLAPNTSTALNITVATRAALDATWAISRRPPRKVTRPSHLHATTALHKIIFASLSLYAHGASLLGGYVRLSTPLVRATFSAQATDKLKCLQSPRRHRQSDKPAISTTTHRPSQPRTSSHGPIEGYLRTATARTTPPSTWMKTDNPSPTHPPSLLPILWTPMSRIRNELVTDRRRQQARPYHSLVFSEEVAKLLELRPTL
jgi:hypothetical protein